MFSAKYGLGARTEQVCLTHLQIFEDPSLDFMLSSTVPQKV